MSTSFVHHCPWTARGAGIRLPKVLMPLFVAQHRHPPESCSAFLSESELLSRVSATAAARHGIGIEAEALIEVEHRLLLVVEAAEQETVEGFLGFLRQSGELEVLPASTVEEAVERLHVLDESKERGDE
ncbi:MAG: hypothetical protein JST31_00285 [Actinobacteria bacterium]|nr:hypothetical protein [Actinomycetota bacterium]